ncbi:hypothetical protein ACB092_08G202800 [Castanea dentata]
MCGKECLNFADSPTRGLPAPNLTLLKVRDCLHLKSLPENMDTLLPSLQILDIASCQQVESFLEGLPPNMNCLAIDASALPKGSSRVRKDCSLLINYYCLVMIAGKRSAFLRRTSTSISTLPIKEFQNLRSLDKKGLQILTSLQRLSITNYPRLK